MIELSEHPFGVNHTYSASAERHVRAVPAGNRNETTAVRGPLDRRRMPAGSAPAARRRSLGGGLAAAAQRAPVPSYLDIAIFGLKYTSSFPPIERTR